MMIFWLHSFVLLLVIDCDYVSVDIDSAEVNKLSVLIESCELMNCVKGKG